MRAFFVWWLCGWDGWSRSAGGPRSDRGRLPACGGPREGGFVDLGPGRCRGARTGSRSTQGLARPWKGRATRQNPADEPSAPMANGRACGGRRRPGGPCRPVRRLGSTSRVGSPMGGRPVRPLRIRWARGPGAPRSRPRWCYTISGCRCRCGTRPCRRSRVGRCSGRGRCR